MKDHIVDPYAIDDSFVTALARADHIEGCVRLWFTAPEVCAGETLLVVKTKLMVPVSVLVPIGRAVLTAATQQEVEAIGGDFRALAH